VYNISPTLSDNNYIDLGDNKLEFTVQNQDEGTTTVVVDVTDAMYSLTHGGTIGAYETDIIGHLISALGDFE